MTAEALVESFLLLAREGPLALVSFFWIVARRGRAPTKRWLARRVELRVDLLPYNKEVIEAARQARAHGRKVFLATGADIAIAEAVAKHLQIFDGVWGSDGYTNLTNKAKRDLLVRLFGPKGFQYIGNSWSDLPVWAVSAGPLIANAGKLTKRAITRLPGCVLVSSRASPLSWIPRCMRIHQWVKNILIFVPLIASHRITEVSLLWDTLFGWGCMSLTASALYILNDLFDLDSDRQHPVKLHRPFAAGEAPLLQGLFLGVILLVSSLAAAWLLPNRFVWVVVTYAIVTMTYTWLLKRQVFLDVLSLSLLFTLRIIGGYEVTGVAYSSWLLALSMFLFLSLALLKRYSELQFRLNRGEVAAFGRDYYVSDIQLVQAFGVSSGYTAALVLARV